MCSCVQVFTQVTTQGGRQYQVGVSSIFVILLEGGILIDNVGSDSPAELPGSRGTVSPSQELPWLFPSVPCSSVLPFLCHHRLACFASLNYLSYSCILSREPQAGRLEKCQGLFLSQVCSCGQVFTQVTTQDGRQYQVFEPPGSQPISHRRLL